MNTACVISKCENTYAASNEYCLDIREYEETRTVSNEYCLNIAKYEEILA